MMQHRVTLTIKATLKVWHQMVIRLARIKTSKHPLRVIRLKALTLSKIFQKHLARWNQALQQIVCKSKMWLKVSNNLMRAKVRTSPTFRKVTSLAWIIQAIQLFWSLTEFKRLQPLFKTRVGLVKFPHQKSKNHLMQNHRWTSHKKHKRERWLRGTENL